MGKFNVRIKDIIYSFWGRLQILLEYVECQIGVVNWHSPETKSGHQDAVSQRLHFSTFYFLHYYSCLQMAYATVMHREY